MSWCPAFEFRAHIQPHRFGRFAAREGRRGRGRKRQSAWAARTVWRLCCRSTASASSQLASASAEDAVIESPALGSAIGPTAAGQSRTQPVSNHPALDREMRRAEGGAGGSLVRSPLCSAVCRRAQPSSTSAFRPKASRARARARHWALCVHPVSCRERRCCCEVEPRRNCSETTEPLCAHCSRRACSSCSCSASASASQALSSLRPQSTSTSPPAGCNATSFAIVACPDKPHELRFQLTQRIVRSSQSVRARVGCGALHGRPPRP